MNNPYRSRQPISEYQDVRDDLRYQACAQHRSLLHFRSILRVKDEGAVNNVRVVLQSYLAELTRVNPTSTD